MLPAGVLFDFSGTLFHIEPVADLVRATLGEQFVHLAPELLRRGGINGSDLGPGVTAAEPELWQRRDLDAAAHRAAYSAQAVGSGLTPEQAARLYDRGVSADAWYPYADTVSVLRGLRAGGVAVAVVSNIGWDPRPVLRRHGVLDLLDVLLLSDERGLLKPDPEIFRLACTELGVPAERCVMVGDNPVNDGGSVAAGIRFVEVAADPERRGPHDLQQAVGLAPR